MVYTYKIEEEDYHTHVLYTISQSSSATKTRAKIRVMMTLFLVIFACISFGNNSPGQTIYFSILAVVAFLFMPLYTRWNYKKTYLKHVKKFYKDRISESTSLEIKSDALLISDTKGESVLNFSEIAEINELTDYCFLKVTGGQSIIIPTYSIPSSDNLLLELTAIADKHDIPWNDEMNWIWK